MQEKNWPLKTYSSRIHCQRGNPQISQKDFLLTLIKPIARNYYETKEILDVTTLNALSDNDLGDWVFVTVVTKDLDVLSEKSTFLNLLCFFQICFLFPFICVCVFSLRVCLCITLMPGVCAGQNKGSDLLELELEIVVSSKVGTGNGSQDLQQNSPWGFSSSPEDLFPFYFMCMGILFACIPVQHMHAVPLATGRRCWIPELEWQVVVKHLCFLCLKP